ncbi:MAG TPA: ThiF family adenylyltransferase [Vicinamibacteria bacterium]|nr:ThiF family adenylyltransferase [Vicinamibacteria bacterium]
MSRYSRQELFGGIGREGQERIRRARVLVVGCGALGSSLAETMTRAGVASLTVVDRDFVETTNLQRQTLFDEEDAALARPKAVAAEARLRRLNSEVAVRGLVADVDATLARRLVGEADLVLDGTDTFETRYVLNDVCVRAVVPWVYGACVGAHGAVLAVRPGKTPCLRCVLGERPAAGAGETCDTAGVVAPIVQVVAGVQAAEALKLLAGRLDALVDGLFTVDLWAGAFGVAGFGGRAPWCPSCTEGRFDYAEAPASAAAVLCGRDAVQLRGAGAPVDVAALAARLSAAGDVVANAHLVRFRAPDADLVVFADGRAIVKGTADAARARAVLARYVGV